MFFSFLVRYTIFYIQCLRDLWFFNYPFESLDSLGKRLYIQYTYIQFYMWLWFSLHMRQKENLCKLIYFVLFSINLAWVNWTEKKAKANKVNKNKEYVKREEKAKTPSKNTIQYKNEKTIKFLAFWKIALISPFVTFVLWLYILWYYVYVQCAQ